MNNPSGKQAKRVRYVDDGAKAVKVVDSNQKKVLKTDATSDDDHHTIPAGQEQCCPMCETVFDTDFATFEQHVIDHFDYENNKLV